MKNTLNRRQFLAYAAQTSLVLTAPALLKAAMPTKPNILFILTDDEGWTTLSCYGNKLVQTPNLDALSREGMKFTSAYVMPQCTPTRAALLTGQHTARNRMWHVIPWYGTPWARMREPICQENLPRETFTLPKGLKEAGYTTAIIGKWHLTTTQDGNYGGLNPEGATHYGFDHSVPALPNEPNTGDKGVARFTDEAIRFIETNRERPWFLYLAHHTVHRKVVAPPELVAKYRAQGAPETGLGNAPYLAALEHLDNSVGRLLARLDELKLRDDTVVIFMCDNGGIDRVWDVAPFTTGPGTATRLSNADYDFPNAPLRDGKGSQYEGGIRVPCLVRWPGVVKPGSVCYTPVHVVDWMPTLFEMGGARAPRNHILDGISIVSVLRGVTLPERALYWYLPFYELRWAATPCAVIREDDWKLIEYFGDWFDEDGVYHEGARLELYNLRDDIGEKNNLVGQESQRAARLRDKLRAWIKSIPAEIPGPNPHYDPNRPLKETKVKPAFLSGTKESNPNS